MDKVFNFQSECTFNNIEEIHKSLINFIEKKDTISLNLSNIKKADATFFQLICALHKYSEKNRIKITRKGEISSNLLETIDFLGYNLTIKNCQYHDSCLLKDK